MPFNDTISFYGKSCSFEWDFLLSYAYSPLIILNNKEIMDLILQNSSDKRIWLISGLTDVSTSERYVQFDDVDLPEDMPNGEYYYALIINNRDDVVYEFKTDLLKTIVKTDEGDVLLKDLKPLVGLLRVGYVKDNAIYPERENKIYYYKKRNGGEG